MSQNSISNSPDSCGCNDYSKLTANNGIANLSIANTSLTGTGSGVVTVLTAASDGTIIRSIIIKATEPVTTGMVRLFVSNGSSIISLYKEIPIPTTPILTNTPTPNPVLPMFEVKLAGGLKLQPGFQLLATTQNAQTFNVIAEGMNWTYASPLPPTCCNFRQDTANTGLGTVSVANPLLTGGGSVPSIFQSGSVNGNTIKSVTIKALQSTNEGMIRFFIGPNTSSLSLMKEIYIPETTQSGFEPSFKQVVDLDFNLQDTFVFAVSTQLAQSFAITAETIAWTYPY